MDLHDRLTAAVKARLEVARAATEGPWEVVEHRDPWSNRTWDEIEPGVTDTESGALPPNHEDMAHIALNEPARIIRQCEAELELIRQYEEARAFYDRPENRRHPAGEVHGLWTAVKLLAGAYGIEVGGDG